MKANQHLIASLWLVTVLLITQVATAQLPPQQWARKYGGKDTEIPYKIILSTDGGTLIVGYTDSKTGDVNPQPNREYWDLWVVKLDKCGNIIWERSFGGTGYESARDVIQASDGGYLVLGETNSTDGDVIAGYGATKDIWLLKLDASGNLQWQKRYGGTGLDIGNQLSILPDGNLLIVGMTSSNDGNVSGNHGTGGYTDALVLKLTADGNLVWSKCFGGSKNEELFNAQVIDGRIYIAGYANSTDGDIPPDQKNYDVWLLAIDGSGNKVYSKVYGGAQNDVAYSMVVSPRGELVMAGYSTSTDGDVSGNKGDQDYWVLNVSTNGKLNWQKNFGGTKADYASTIINDRDGGFLVGGISYSADGDVSNANGEGDFWVLKISENGEPQSNIAIGGTGNDNLHSMVFNLPLGEYYLAGDSDSDDGDLDFGEGQTDIAVFKYKYVDSIVVDTLVCDLAAFTNDTVLVKDACGYDSAFVSYNPVVLKTPFDGLNDSDTIFLGQSTVLPIYGKGRITWEPQPSLSCTSCDEPIANPTVTTRYNGSTTLNGCTVSGQFTVKVLDDAAVFIPNAFSPNGDGINDSFGPAGKVPDDYKMQIFNRYGEIVFQSTSMNKRWNGTFRGQPQLTNVFVYLIQFKNVHNQMEVRKGTLTLVR